MGWWLLATAVTTFFYSFTGRAADVPRHIAFNTLRQRLDVKAYAGHRFRFSARLRADTAQSDGGFISLFATGFDKNQRFVFGTPRPPANDVKSLSWKTCSVEGVLPKKVDFLMLTLLFSMNGTFGADDCRAEVEEAGKWVVVPMQSADFEEKTPADSLTQLPAGWKEGAPSADFRYKQAVEANGNHFLEIRGRGIVNYGQNRRAGHMQKLPRGVNIYYETYGTGEPLLLLHGNGESINSFREQIAMLAAHYRVIAVDTRGHGQSSTNRERYTYDLFARDMNALLDSLHIPKAHIVGWSDGGNTGLSMAIHYPQRVASLVTMGANLYPKHGAVDKKTIGEIRLIRAVSTVMYPFAPKWRRAHRLATLLIKYPRMKPTELRGIGAPTLVLAGEKDLIMEPHTRLIANSIPGGTCVILPGLTHYAPQENGPLFNQTVIDFLGQHPMAQR
jgi:pimeloyl-ACP methyl ester carboxylesterase